MGKVYEAALACHAIALALTQCACAYDSVYASGYAGIWRRTGVVVAVE